MFCDCLGSGKCFWIIWIGDCWNCLFVWLFKVEMDCVRGVFLLVIDDLEIIFDGGNVFRFIGLIV